MDAKLERAIGLPFVLEKLEPHSPWGRDKKAKLKPFSPADAGALKDALDAVADAQTLEAWRLTDILSRFREIRGTLNRLRTGVLLEAELFELKRFLLNAARLAEALDAQDAPPRFCLPDLQAPLDILDPRGSRDPAFSAAQADEKLLAILRQKTALTAGSEAYLLLLDEEQQALEAALGSLSKRLRPMADIFEKAALAIGELDFALAKAKLAERYGGTRPVFDGDALVLTDLVNPSLPDFYPLSFRFERGATVLTGANMGGKSTALFAVALNVRLALMGLYPFAGEAKMPHFTGICLIAGDASASGLSEFGGQASKLTGAIESARHGALILIDELARGTNPEEGAAIAAAVTEYLNNMPAVSVLTTHFRGVAERAKAHYRAKGHMPGAEKEAVDYAFHLVSGALAPPQEALAVCKIMGLPEEIVARAKELVDRNISKAVEYS